MICRVPEEDTANSVLTPARRRLIFSMETPLPETRLRTWEDFARAVSQEQDPQKLRYLMEELHRALDGDDVRATGGPKSVSSAFSIRAKYRNRDSR